LAVVRSHVYTRAYVRSLACNFSWRSVIRKGMGACPVRAFELWDYGDTPCDVL